MSGVYEWVDEFRFSRSKRNIARDFSDAVLLAELIAQLFPAWVELHNYPSTHRIQQKLSNWETLNRKVLTRIKCEISKKQQEDLANAVPGAIEMLLLQVRKQLRNSNQFQAKIVPDEKNVFSLRQDTIIIIKGE
uniref:Calponin-homology (CH) domain-containing protein n=1 Tax=Globisporangium ultimum (strain ATCC 200006 / CBS 805.95 / DAOM BR144) TaxID=431595 RepID=K3WB14_GLOUD